MNQDKRALILNIGYLEEEMIRALKSMGFYVIGTGNNPDLKGRRLVDKYICADFSDRDLMLKIAKENKIDAICACANDFGVLTAAYVAEKLHLPGHDTYENALIMHNKERFKKFAKKYEIKTPPARYYLNESQAIKDVDDFEYPVIVKPTDLSAGNGITRANNKEEAAAAIYKAFKTSRAHEVVIEPFVEGSLHACCTFIKDRKAVVCCSNNEYCIVNPYRVEIATYPADNFDEVKQDLISQAEKMAGILDLKDGILSMQYIYKNGEIHIIEAMRRVLGNLYMDAAKLANGFDWNYWEARVHAGLDYQGFPSETEQTGFYAYRAIMADKNGIVKGITIPEDIKDHVVKLYKLREVGDEISNYMSQPLWFLVLKFDSKESMRQIMLDRYKEIYVELESSEVQK